MVVRRDSLRAQTNFFSPMTGNTRTSITPKKRYGDEVKSRMAGMEGVRSTRTNPIQAAFVKLIKTDDPFTQIDTKKSYAPEEEEGLLEGLGNVGESDVAERVEEFLEPITSGGGGGGGTSPNEKRLQRQAEFDANPPAKASTSQLVARDNRRYGDTVPAGSFGSGSVSTIKASPTSKVDTNIARHSVGGPEDQPPTKPPVETPKPNLMFGQGGLPLGTTAPRQVVSGMTTGVKDGVKVEAKPKVAINASSFQQKNVRGSGNPNNTGKDESARPKTVTIGGQTVAARQTVASLPSNYKATEAEAFRVAKAYKEAKAIAERNPNVSVSVDSKGRPTATANQQTRSEAGAKTAQANKARVQNNAKARAQAAAVSRKLSGKSISQTKAANKASMKAAAAARHASFKQQKKAGTHARTASAQRARNKAAAKARAKAAAKRRRSKKKCDITIKYDISTLTNMNLLRDDLANVAYFVKELQETI